MLTLTKYSSICLSVCKAQRSTPTTLFTMAATHAGGGRGAQSRQPLCVMGEESVSFLALNSSSPSPGASVKCGQEITPEINQKIQPALKDALANSSEPFNQR